MFIVGFLTWWYGAGWRQQVVRLRERLAATMDYFSIELLLRTLFQPFRQISAGRTDGPLGMQLRAFFDRLISRFIGALIRSFMIVVGSVAIVITGLLGAWLVLCWAIVPLLPIVGIFLFSIGWLPWNL